MALTDPPIAVDALVFDAYGTLFDVHALTSRAEELLPGHGSMVSRLWRTKQLEYTWLQSLMGPAVREDFEAVRIGFVSSNGWDAIGAKAFGFNAFWINRAGAPLDLHGPAPDRIISTLADLPSLLA